MIRILPEESEGNYCHHHIKGTPDALPWQYRANHDQQLCTSAVSQYSCWLPVLTIRRLPIARGGLCVARRVDLESCN